MSKKPYDYRLFVNGNWRAGGDGVELALINPSNAKEFGKVAAASIADLDEALHSASTSRMAWSNTPAPERGALLIKAAQILRENIEPAAIALSMEQGKTLAEARAAKSVRNGAASGSTTCPRT